MTINDWSNLVSWFISHLFTDDLNELDAMEEKKDEFAVTVPTPLDKFSPCQYVFVGLLAAVLLYFVGFIIYISCTWNKDRINEYS